MRPGRIIDALGLTGAERVLELGPGPGFFSVEIARRLTDGRLDLFDLQPEMLEKARRRLARDGFIDIGFTSGQASQEFPFPDNSWALEFASFLDSIKAGTRPIGDIEDALAMFEIVDQAYRGNRS